MSGRPDRIPRIAALLVRVALPAEDVERALADLADVSRRVARGGSRRMAAFACVREALSIALWSTVDRVRRAMEVRDGVSVREQRRQSMLRDLVHDVGYGAGALARRPGFTLLAAGLLALGTGAVTPIFTLAMALFVSPPPGLRAPEELIRVSRSWAPGEGGAVGYPLPSVSYRRCVRGAATCSG